MITSDVSMLYVVRTVRFTVNVSISHFYVPIPTIGFNISSCDTIKMSGLKKGKIEQIILSSKQKIGTENSAGR